MERLTEQPVGDGDVFDGAICLGRVHYHLSVYRRFSDVESEMVPAHLEVEGRVLPLGGIDIARLHDRQSELTLRLADGRLLDFRVANASGAVRSTAKGLYTPDVAPEGAHVVQPSGAETYRAPFADLERTLIDAFVRARGFDPLRLGELPEPEREALLEAASVDASLKLTEVESRARYVQAIHHLGQGIVKTGLD